MSSTARSPLRTFSPRSFGLAALALTCAPGPWAQAQQFVFTDVLPGPARWTEGVAAADVDGDGDADLFFADGEDYSSPGPKRQNRLVVNQLELSAGQFADESLARLGASESHAKMVFVGDMDGDGWVDACFANAFNIDPPFLFHNRGVGQPGFFDEEGAARGISDPLNCASGNFADVDNDGDLDLALCDSGPAYVFGAGGKPRLYRNDGAGVFTNDPAFAAAVPTKSSQMDIQFVDLDNDFDLDYFGVCRTTQPGGSHYLLINQGDGTFANASPAQPGESGFVYEAEAADLDGDLDADQFFVSLEGFGEGVVRNQLSETGSPGLTIEQVIGADDDNEVALLDFDDDGDLDPLVGRLQGGTKFYRNLGGLVFQLDTSIVEQVFDSTLDLTVVDLDNDGALDLVTTQGESNPAQWNDKAYRNLGPADSRPPVLERLESTDAWTSAGPWVLRAAVRDAFLDDGQDGVSAIARYRVTSPLGTSEWLDGEAVHQGGGGLWRMELAALDLGLADAVTYEWTFTDGAGNATSTGEVTVDVSGPCGFAGYGAANGALLLSADGAPAPGSSVTLNAAGLDGLQPLVWLGSGLPAQVPLGSATLWLDPTLLFLVQVDLPGSSVLVVPIPDDAALVGERAYFQVAQPDAGQPGGWSVSAGLAATVCP